MSIVCVTDKFFAIGNFLCDQTEKPLWKQKSRYKWKLLSNATIKFGVNIFLRWYLKKKKNCKHKYHDVKVKF